MQRSFDTPGHLRLNLEIPSGRVDVETVEGATTHVELSASDSDLGSELLENARIELLERADGHELVVEVRSRSGFWISFGRGPELRLRVTCPPGADADVRTKSADVRGVGRYGSVMVKSASGDISFGEVEHDARFKTASGDVHLDTAHGTTHLQTASGDLSVQRATGNVSAQLVSGDVWIRDAAASVNLNTVSGDQRIDGVVEGAIELHSVSGDIVVGVRRGSRVYVDANTVSGSTSSELELADAPGGVAVAEGPLVEVRAKTVSGDVSIVRAAAPSPAAEFSG